MKKIRKDKTIEHIKDLSKVLLLAIPCSIVVGVAFWFMITYKGFGIVCLALLGIVGIVGLVFLGIKLIFKGLDFENKKKIREHRIKLGGKSLPAGSRIWILDRKYANDTMEYCNDYVYDISPAFVVAQVDSFIFVSRQIQQNDINDYLDDPLRKLLDYQARKTILNGSVELMVVHDYYCYVTLQEAIDEISNVDFMFGFQDAISPNLFRAVMEVEKPTLCQKEYQSGDSFMKMVEEEARKGNNNYLSLINVPLSYRQGQDIEKCFYDINDTDFREKYYWIIWSFWHAPYDDSNYKFTQEEICEIRAALQEKSKSFYKGDENLIASGDKDEIERVRFQESIEEIIDMLGSLC